MDSPLGFGRIVTRFAHLRQLTDQANRLRQLDVELRAAIPSPLDAHAHLATMHDGCVVLQADSPAWATQLRYKTPEILANLQRNPAFASIRSIRIRNALTAVEPSPPPPLPRALGPAAADALRAQAESSADPALREVLLRLAGRATGPERR
jgi:hypothetical protein